MLTFWHGNTFRTISQHRICKRWWAMENIGTTWRWENQPGPQAVTYGNELKLSPLHCSPRPGRTFIGSSLTSHKKQTCWYNSYVPIARGCARRTSDYFIPTFPACASPLLSQSSALQNVADPLSIAASVLAILGAVKGAVSVAKTVYKGVKEQENLNIELEALARAIKTLQGCRVDEKDVEVLRRAKQLVSDLHKFLVQSCDFSSRDRRFRSLTTMRYKTVVGTYCKLIEETKEALTFLNSVTTV